MSDSITPDKNGYLYLIREREFLLRNENVFKIGATVQQTPSLQLDRLKKYKKGSQLLYTSICNHKTVFDLETKIKKAFKKQFQKHSDGYEYFIGNPIQMIICINNILSIELNNVNNLNVSRTCTHDNTNSLDASPNDVDKTITINTYTDFVHCTGFDNRIVITNKSTQEGHLQLDGGEWCKLYNSSASDYDDNTMETLQGFIKHWSTSNAYKIYGKKSEFVSEKIWIEMRQQNLKYMAYTLNYNYNSILTDICDKCYTKNPVYHQLKYHEYVILKHLPNKTVTHEIFDIKIFNFHKMDEAIGTNILTTPCGGRSVWINEQVNDSIVKTILNSLITKPTIVKEFRNFCYNVLVESSDNLNIFYDYTSSIVSLSEMLQDALYTISGNRHFIQINNEHYGSHKKEIRENIKLIKPRCVFVSMRNESTLDNIIIEMAKLGVKNIIFTIPNSQENFYNMNKFVTFLRQNEPLIKSNIVDKDYDFCKNNDRLFYKSGLLHTHFLKWCSCVNKH